MGKKKLALKAPDFAVGDYVLAKMRGWPFWPAEVKQVIRPKFYLICFFGTKNIAKIGGNSLRPYNDENCVKLNTEREMRKPGYAEAIDALEAQKLFNEQLMLQAVVESPSIADEAQQNEPEDDDVENESENDDMENVPEEIQLKPRRPAAKKIVRKIKKEPEDSFRIRQPLAEKGQQQLQDQIYGLIPRPIPTKRRIKKEQVQKVRRVAPKSNVNPVKIGTLRLQFQLIDYTHVLRCSLTRDKSKLNIDKALVKMKELNVVLKEATSFMLLKYPHVVETQKNLRYYAGNNSVWQLKENEVKVFKEKAEIIKTLAIENFALIENLFDIPSGSTFEETFNAQADEIKQKCEEKKLNFDVIFETLSMIELDNLEDEANAALIDPAFV